MDTLERRENAVKLLFYMYTSTNNPNKKYVDFDKAIGCASGYTSRVVNGDEDITPHDDTADRIYEFYGEWAKHNPPVIQLINQSAAMPTKRVLHNTPMLFDMD